MLRRTMLEEKKSSGQSANVSLPTPSMLCGKQGSFAVWPFDYAGAELGYLVNTKVPARNKGGWKELQGDT